MTRTHRSKALLRRVSALAVLFVFISATVLTPIPVSANNVADIDKDHQLAQPAPEDWGPTATADVMPPDVTITVTESAAECGYKGKTNDKVNKYVCIEYREEIERTLRTDIHKSYLTRIDKEGQESLDGDSTADFEPLENHTRMTVDVTGPTTLIFPVSKVESNTQDLWRSHVERGQKAKEKATGSSGIFGFFGGEDHEWNHIESIDLASDEVVIDHARDDIQLEYDADPSEEQDWRMVPDDPNNNPPVYWYSKDGEDATRVVSEKSDEGVPVRYKEGGKKGFWAQGWDDFTTVDRGKDVWPLW